MAEEKKKKKTKVIDVHQQYKKLNKVSKKIFGFGVSFGIISAITILTVSILSLIGIFPMPTDSVRTYGAEFVTYDDKVLFKKIFKRGEVLEYEEFDMDRPDDEDGTTYTFIGWDITGDSIPDIIPSRMYYSFKAIPVYFEFNPHGVIKHDDEEEENDSEEPNELQEEAIYYASK